MVGGKVPSPNSASNCQGCSRGQEDTRICILAHSQQSIFLKHIFGDLSLWHYSRLYLTVIKHTHSIYSVKLQDWSIITEKIYVLHHCDSLDMEEK